MHQKHVDGMVNSVDPDQTADQTYLSQYLKFLSEIRKPISAYRYIEVGFCWDCPLPLASCQNYAYGLQTTVKPWVRLIYPNQKHDSKS